MKITISFKEKEMNLVKDIIREMEVMDEYEIDVLDHDVTSSYGPVVFTCKEENMTLDIRDDLSTIVLDGFLVIAKHVKYAVMSLIGIFKSISERAEALFDGEEDKTTIDGMNSNEYFKKLKGEYEEVNDEKCSDKI